MALPPTATKFSTDVNNVTTFFFAFPNFTGSHSGITATLGVNSVAGGGTGLAILTANNVILGNGTASPTFIAPGTSGNLLTSNGTTWLSAPAAFVNPMITAGDIIYEDATPTPVRLGIGSTGQVLAVVGGFPAWSTFSPSFTGLTPNAPVIAATSSTITTTTTGTTGQVFTSAGPSSPPGWQTLGGVTAFAAYNSNQINTASSLITAVTFVTYSNSPGFSITPTITGTYKVYCSITVQSLGTTAICRIINTSGGATLLAESQSANIPTSAGTSDVNSTVVQSVYNLTAGTTYVFDIQGQANGGTGQTNRGDLAPFYIFAEGIALTTTNTILGDFEVTNGHYESTQTTAPTTTTLSGAGTGATSSVTQATDTAGICSVTSGTLTLGSGGQFTVNFNSPYAVSPIVQLTPQNSATTAAYYVTSTTSGFTVNFVSAGLPATTYSWFYTVMETQ